MISAEDLVRVASRGSRPLAVREVYPSYEGFNIDLYLGFKHFGYLVEEGVLQAFRSVGAGPHALYVQHGLDLELVGVAMRLLATIHLDDLVRIEVWPETRDQDTEMRFRVALATNRHGEPVTTATATARAVLRQDARRSGRSPVSAALARFVRAPSTDPARLPRRPIRASSGHSVLVDDPDVHRALAPADGNAIIWKLRVPYYYCHFTDHLQLSGYLRMLEQTVDLFLASRGISIGRFLAERDWIPVVLEASIETLADVWMEEEVHTVFAMEALHGEAFWASRVDCYVWREGTPMRTASGHITHAYAQLRGPGDAQACRLDPQTQALLRPRGEGYQCR